MYQYQNQNFDDTIAGQSAIRKVLLAEADDVLSELPGAKARGKTLTPPIIISQEVHAAEPKQSIDLNPLAADTNRRSERKRRRVTRSRRAARSRGSMRLKFL